MYHTIPNPVCCGGDARDVMSILSLMVVIIALRSLKINIPAFIYSMSIYAQTIYRTKKKKKKKDRYIYTGIGIQHKRRCHTGPGFLPYIMKVERGNMNDR